MDPSEREIFNYLKPLVNQFISSREICRRAGGKQKFQENPDWAKPLLHRMEERGILETDPGGHYRIKPPPKKETKKRWISPQFAKILERSGKGTAETFVIDDEDYYEKL